MCCPFGGSHCRHWVHVFQDGAAATGQNRHHSATTARFAVRAWVSAVSDVQRGEPKCRVFGLFVFLFWTQKVSIACQRFRTELNTTHVITDCPHKVHCGGSALSLTSWREDPSSVSLNDSYQGNTRIDKLCEAHQWVVTKPFVWPRKPTVTVSVAVTSYGFVIDNIDCPIQGYDSVHPWSQDHISCQPNQTWNILKVVSRSKFRCALWHVLKTACFWSLQQHSKFILLRALPHACCTCQKKHMYLQLHSSFVFFISINI